MRFPPGTRLGAYEILAAIAAGGMGEVYRARDTRLDRTVALKVLPPQLATDPLFRERFDREARTISQLTHPNICTLHDLGEHDGTAFLVMEHLEGETLAAPYVVTGVGRQFDISPDGKRFLMLKAAGSDSSIVIVSNWLEEVRAKMDGAR